jgi:DNA-binding NarL/FixJ family response regulator
VEKLPEKIDIMLYVKEFLAMLVLAIVVIGNLGDVFYDYREGASLNHVLMELSIAIISFALIAGLTVGIWRQTRSNNRLKVELESYSETNKQALSPALASARHELALVLKDQFESWKLTQTERQVAMLLLKGLSFKEIASVRNTMEKTVRQQASAIYKKSNVSGRHAFSAWFIEDLL